MVVGSFIRDAKVSRERCSLNVQREIHTQDPRWTWGFSRRRCTIRDNQELRPNRLRDHAEGRRDRSRRGAYAGIAPRHQSGTREHRLARRGDARSGFRLARGVGRGRHGARRKLETR